MNPQPLQSIAVGQVYRHEHDGQRFCVTRIEQTMHTEDITLAPIDPPVRQDDGTYKGEKFDLGHMTAEALNGPNWTLLEQW